MKTDPRPTSLGASLSPLCLVVLALVFSPGCLLVLGAGAGAGGAAFVMGKLESELDASVTRVHGATVAGIESLGMGVRKNQVDKLSAKVESKTADDKDVWIHIDSVTQSKSKISIRVGVWGDESRSQVILQAIQERL